MMCILIFIRFVYVYVQHTDFMSSYSIVHPTGSIKQEDVSFLLKKIETQYEVYTTEDFNMYCTMSSTPL